ncbi:hypothetical protein DR950_39440 [Kitasatospora xanthocidica]|uniref:Uncharacterized protein n=1 Tax=Kitasatospora xanthocidica TaxID=83382 RepID=A0A372ZHY3_9ACTN|nr:hypothetical protein [Kitasatospora xanthocidica]RGD55448.1 hypothetical protein DR950_39440 [Kitasatospora xanthocidica]
MFSSYEIKFPTDLDGYEFEVECKGRLFGVGVRVGDAVYDLTVYDEERLAQDAKAAVEAGRIMTAVNLLVIPSVTREVIAEAVARLARTGFGGLAPRQ